MRFVLLAVATLSFTARLSAEGWKPLTTEAEIQGSFLRGVSPANSRWEDPRNVKRTIYGSGPLGLETGWFRTGLFTAPPQLRCFIAGFPQTKGIRIYLRDEATGSELQLGSKLPPADLWQERIWKVPADWQRRRVRFQVDDLATEPIVGAIALTLPEAGSHSMALPFARAAYRTAFLVLEFTWFLIPGIAMALWLKPKDTLWLAATALTSAAGIGYAVFWVYLLHPKAGVVVSGLTLVSAAALILKRRRTIPKELALLFAAVLLTATFYNSLGFLFYTEDGPGEMVQNRFFNYNLPPDNVLQYLFAFDVFNGVSVHPFLIATVKSSDRPPLLTALAIAQWPFWRILNQINSYHLLGVGLQCVWVAALWIFLRAAGVSPPAIVAAVASVLFTQFAWLNSLYVWPKLLSASFCLIGMAAIPAFRTLTRGAAQPWTRRSTALMTASFSLSLLSHAGSGFTIVAVGLFLAIRRSLPPLRLVPPSIAIALLLLLPWRGYQKFADPPGDTLLKLHLAGVSDETLDLKTSLIQAYTGTPVKQIAANKLANLASLFYWHEAPQSATNLGALLTLFNFTFFAFFPCAGLLNLGLLARLRLKASSPYVQFADSLVLVTLASLAVWCFLMFQPYTAVVHQGSYATVLLYFTAMAIYLYSWSPRAFWGVIAVQACIIFPVLVLLEPIIARNHSVVWNDSLDWGMATAAVLSLLLLAALGVFVSRNSQTLQLDPVGLPEKFSS